ncbi:hypothetical protein GYMLUDRAFT_117917, partial [Collybiopsis luxurians FD-317 M1]
CIECRTSNGVYRCKDCTGGFPHCQKCILCSHRSLPLHSIEKWDGSHFIQVSLHSLGLKYQLGHLPGEYCNHVTPAHTNFHVIHSNGIHEVSIAYCRCIGVPQHYKQLLEVGWWPATGQEPQTAATVNVLQCFHVLNLCGHISPTDFYQSLEEITNGTG